MTGSPRGLGRRLHVLQICFVRGSCGSVCRSQQKALSPVGLRGFHRYTARQSLSSVKQRQDGEAIDDQDHQPVAGTERADRANQHPVKEKPDANQNNVLSLRFRTNSQSPAAERQLYKENNEVCHLENRRAPFGPVSRACVEK